MGQANNKNIKKRVGEIKKEVEELEISRKKSKKVLEESKKETLEIENRIKDRKERAKERQEKAKQVGKIIIILFIIGGMVLGGTKVSANEPDVPFDKYLEMTELANFYKTLYEEAEKDLEEADRDNELLLKQIRLLQDELEIRITSEEIMQKRIEELMDMITKLIKGKSLNVKGGVGAKYNIERGLRPPEAFAFVVLEWNLLGR